MTEVEYRPHFYEGQYLDAADLDATVQYTQTQRARTLLGAHRWGIAIGLELLEVPGPNNTLDMVISPGYGWDGFGRPVLVPEPAKLSVGQFAALDAAYVPGNPPPSPVPVDIWLRYTEATGGGPRPGFETCDDIGAYSRVQERFAVEVGPKQALSDRRDPIEIAGRTMDAAQALHTFDAAVGDLVDASVPHQVLPAEGETAIWLLPIGTVTYQPGSPGSFVKRDAATVARSAASRQYCGVVAGSVEAAGGVVHIHDRMKPYSTFATDELLCVEGNVRADGDVRLFGHRLEFISSHTEDPRVPFQLLRHDDLATGSGALTLVIGDKNTGLNRLVVGPKNGVDAAGNDTHAARLTVTDKGPVGVGVDDPKALLHVGADGVQIGASTTAEDNFYVQSNTDGPRGLRFYNKNVGSGTPLLSLTSTGRVGVGDTAPTNTLHVNGALGIRQNAMYLSGNTQWSSLTYNAHHNEANSAWEFPDPSHPAATIEMDAVNGYPRVEVYTTIPGNNQAWASRLMVRGDSGNVGIGTGAPAAKLDVRGDIVASGNVALAGGSAVATSSPTRMIWGAVRPDGTVAAGDGFTAGQLGGGRYQINFATPFAGPPVVVVTHVFGDITVNAGAAVSAAETAEVDVAVADHALISTANASGTRTDGGFTFIAIGPR